MHERASHLAAIILCGTVGCSPSGDAVPSRTDVGSSAVADGAIDSVMAAYITAVEGGDTATIAGIFTEDVEILFPTGPMRKGRADAMAAFTRAANESSREGLCGSS